MIGSLLCGLFRFSGARLEFLHATGGVERLFGAGVVWVTRGANLDGERFLSGTHNERRPARAGYRRTRMVCRVYVRFHSVEKCAAGRALPCAVPCGRALSSGAAHPQGAWREDTTNGPRPQEGAMPLNCPSERLSVPGIAPQATPRPCRRTAKTCCLRCRNRRGSTWPP